MSVAQTTTANATVDPTAIRTDRVDCFLRNARRPSSSSLGRRVVESVTVSTLAERAPTVIRSRELRDARVRAEPFVGDLLELAGVAQGIHGGGHLRGERGVLREEDAPFVGDAGRGQFA